MRLCLSHKRQATIILPRAYLPYKAGIRYMTGQCADFAGPEVGPERLVGLSKAKDEAINQFSGLDR